MLTPLALLLAVVGGAWGYASDRIAVRWPEHDEEELPAGRAPGWRTVVAVIVGAMALGAVPLRFHDLVVVLVFSVYVVALTLLLAIDLDQRLLPNEITLPLIPLALAFGLTGVNPLVTPAAMPLAAAVAIVAPVLVFLLSIPFGAGAFGLGDVKLLVSVGIIGGAWRLISGMVYGFVLAGVVIVVLLLFRRLTLKSFIPFGPFLIIGAFWALLGLS